MIDIHDLIWDLIWRIFQHKTQSVRLAICVWLKTHSIIHSTSLSPWSIGGNLPAWHSHIPTPKCFQRGTREFLETIPLERTWTIRLINFRKLKRMRGILVDTSGTLTGREAGGRRCGTLCEAVPKLINQNHSYGQIGSVVCAYTHKHINMHIISLSNNLIRFLPVSRTPSGRMRINIHVQQRQRQRNKHRTKKKNKQQW